MVQLIDVVAILLLMSPVVLISAFVGFYVGLCQLEDCDD